MGSEMLTQSTDDGTLLIHICKEKDILVGHDASISERLAMGRSDRRVSRMFVVEMKREKKDPHRLKPQPPHFFKKRAKERAEFED
jgi:hypothetical protein